MATTTRSAIDAVLKNDYAPKLADQLTSESLVWRELEKGRTGTQGRKMVWPARVRRGDGARFTAEDADLPEAGVQVYAECNMEPTTVASRMAITEQLLASAKTDRGAFLSGLDAQTKNSKDDLLHAIGTATFGYGGAGLDAAVSGLTGIETGVYCTINGAVAGATTVTVDAGDGQPGTRLLRPGMKLNIGTAAQLSGGTGDDVVVSSITSDTVFEATTSVTLADNDIAARGIAASHSYLKDANGIAHIVSNVGDLHGVSLTTYPEWKAKVSENSGTARDLTPELIMASVRLVAKDRGVEPDLLVMSYEQQSVYQAQLLPQQRYANVQVDGGVLTQFFSNGQSSRMKIIVDRFCPQDRCYGITKSELFIGEQKAFGFHDRNGSALQPRANKLGWDVSYYGIYNVGCLTRNAHFVIEDLNIA